MSVFILNLCNMQVGQGQVLYEWFYMLTAIAMFNLILSLMHSI